MEKTVLILLAREERPPVLFKVDLSRRLHIPKGLLLDEPIVTVPL
jgi:hypothetical protein